MNLLSGTSDFFSLDIGTTAIRLVQLRASANNTKTLVKYAYVPVDSKIVASDARADQQKLVQTVKELVTQAQLATHNVAVGLPAQKVFTTVVDVDRLPPNELKTAIRYQADALIPTAIAESKIDFANLGDSPADKTKIEILLSSVTNKFIEERLDLLESIGLNVIAFEPDSMALTRALIAPGSAAPQMVLDVGNRNTDLV
ncbi:MAG: type IV pilus biogenesis protein PilM, partial [Candidatus Saccharimonadales bacterium]